jgi:hypothetical protein
MERRLMMKRVFATITSIAFFAALTPVAGAQTQQCPAEVGQAQAMLQKVSKTTWPLNDVIGTGQQDVQAPRSLAGARSSTQDVQAPRSSTQDVQAPRSSTQDVQAPRSSTQDVQAPRSSTQDVQAPRSSTQDVQAPRSSTQDVQAPRSSTQDVQAPRSSTQDVQAPRTAAGAKTGGADAAKLVREAEAACKTGKMDVAKAKAIEAIGLMK